MNLRCEATGRDGTQCIFDENHEGREFLSHSFECTPIDNVNFPPHYKSGGLEVIDVIEAFGLHKDLYLGNVVKYVLRHAKKNGIEDLKKAQYYLNRAIANAEKK